MTVLIDTLKASSILREAGFEKEKAEAITQVISRIDTDSLATKADLKDLENKLLKWVFMLQITSVATLVGVIIGLLSG